jgi:hypothetical protein
MWKEHKKKRDIAKKKRKEKRDPASQISPQSIRHGGGYMANLPTKRLPSGFAPISKRAYYILVRTRPFLVNQITPKSLHMSPVPNDKKKKKKQKKQRALRNANNKAVKKLQNCHEIGGEGKSTIFIYIVHVSMTQTASSTR